MDKMSLSKVLGGIAVVAIVAAVGYGLLNRSVGFQDGGVDVNNTACDEIGAARQAVNQELNDRKTAAAETLETEMESASDAYWAENRRLESVHHECMTGALVADPCKAPFEKIGQLYEEIMADFAADKGFNEAKFNEREQAKKDYEECVERARNDEFYEADKSKCDADLAAGQSANQQTRQAAEAAAQAKHDAAVAQAESAHQAKHGILDAIEEKCNEPAGNTNVNAGAISAGSTGTTISTGSACTGTFEGNDPELRARLSLLESQLQKARAAGLSGGLYGTDHLQSAVDQARQELRESERSCTTDADCGDPTPVCCSNTEVGRVYCDAGTCANERVACDDGQICAGSPAMCVNPTTGAQSQPIELGRTIPEVGSCSINLQNLDLQQGSPGSARFEIVGFPSWVHASQVGGNLPASSNLTYDCNTVQGFGPGTYTANGSILVKDGGGNLINTIPVNIMITVEPAQQDQIAVIQYGSYYIPVDQIHSGTGQECDQTEHWHANGPTVTATDGTKLSDPDPSGCGFGKTSQVPVMHMAAPSVQGEIRVEGLDSLRTR
ncbi:MAG TPA: hypothetical protein VGA08_03810 [Candidatus Saccharimonadales bacterium]